MNTPTEMLQQLADMVAARVDVSSLAVMPATELIELTAAIEQLGRVVDARRVAAANAIERRSNRWLGTGGLAQSYGYRRGGELIEQLTGASAVTVRRRITLGQSICDRDGSLGVVLPPLYPEVARAVAVGRIGTDTARVITTELAQTGSRAHPDAVLMAERILVAQAAGRPEDVVDLVDADLVDADLADADLADADLPADVPAETDANPCPGPMPADLIAVQARVWRDALDPDGVEPRADIARFGRGVTLSRTPVGGLHALRGKLTPDVAATVLAYFDMLIVRQGTCLAGEDTVPGESPAETRSFTQQCHDLFAAMVRAAGAAADTDVPAPAPLIIQLDADQLEKRAATGSISGVTGPVPLSYLQQIACDGGIQLLATRRGKVVKLGIKGRFFTQSQRRAVAVRDGSTCCVPGCDVPFAALEAHHVNPHRHGGPTHVDNCVLPCWWHHHMIDAGIWVVEMIRGRPRIHVPIRSNISLVA
ncbi:MAG: DUF222 domain-containing protein [Microbacteriaceae bacterium]